MTLNVLPRAFYSKIEGFLSMLLCSESRNAFVNLFQICACEQGFELKSNGGICEDVDECRRLSGRPCSQTCINTEGSYRCTCHPGYLLEPDGHTCKATG